MALKQKWGDVDDNDNTEVKNISSDVGFVTMGPDGLKHITEFRTDEAGKKMKVVRKVRETKEVVRVSKRVLNRRKWAKYGDCTGFPPGPEENVTYKTRENIKLDLKPRTERKEEDEDDSLKKQLAGKTSIVVCRFCGEMGHFSLRCPKREEIQAKGVKSEPDSGHRSKGGDKYVPIFRRKDFQDTNPSDRQEDYSIRVTNISEDTTENDLRTLFRRFGHTSRIYLAKDHSTGMSRGFAFISYTRREDAQMAIAKLDGHGYDNLILRVEVAKPPQERTEKKDPNWTMRGTK